MLKDTPILLALGLGLGITLLPSSGYALILQNYVRNATVTVENNTSETIDANVRFNGSGIEVNNIAAGGTGEGEAISDPPGSDYAFTGLYQIKITPGTQVSSYVCHVDYVFRSTDDVEITATLSESDDAPSLSVEIIQGDNTITRTARCE